jgi:ATP-dependent Zn protease
VFKALNAGSHVAICAPATLSLPDGIADLCAKAVSVGKFNKDSLAAALAMFHGMADLPSLPDEEWARLANPMDLVAAKQCGPGREVEALRDQVVRRLESTKPPTTAVALADLSGIGAAHDWARKLIADLKSAVAGEIGWDEVDKGALLVGPPGTGKTSVARAIAAESGVRMVATTATSWQTAGALDAVLSSMSRDFAKAAEVGPSILFIDEIDAVGSREAGGAGGSGHAQWIAWTVNHLLALMDGFDKSRQVVVIAATNHPEKVDPALRRSGRLDRAIKIPLPGVKALGGIYRHYLKGVAHSMGDADVAECAASSIGNTGADVERHVREARRAARMAKRPVSKQDLLGAIYDTPDEGQRQPMGKAELANTAWHEAGHAVLAATGGPEALSSVRYISIVPRADGTLGFVATSPKEGRVSMTAKSGRHRLEMLLAGRAAEETAFGKEGVTGGCASDLAAATRLALSMRSSMGLGAKGRLAVFESKEGFDDEIELMLQEAYASARAKLAEHRGLLDALARELLEHSEISGSRFAALAALHGVAVSEGAEPNLLPRPSVDLHAHFLRQAAGFPSGGRMSAA